MEGTSGGPTAEEGLKGRGHSLVSILDGRSLEIPEHARVSKHHNPRKDTKRHTKLIYG